MKIALFGRSFDLNVAPYIRELFDTIKQREVELLIFHELNEYLIEHGIVDKTYSTFTTKDEIQNVECVFSLGGDGTLLETLTYVGEKQIPILGINAGRLGFLATVTVERIPEALTQFFEGKFTYDDRTLIQLDTKEEIFNGLNYALNEFAILKRETSSMIVVHTYLNGEFLNSYWADGLIVSTPTGSTGYSLSCGGPLVMPQTRNFIIAPINPHNLTVRPMIVDDDAQLSFKIEGRNEKYLVSLDSRSQPIDASVELSVRKCDFKARLISIDNSSYFNTLRNKLKWGLDVRN